MTGSPVGFGPAVRLPDGVDLFFPGISSAAVIATLVPALKVVGYMLARTWGLRECFLHAPSRIDNNLAESGSPPDQALRKVLALRR